MLTFAYLGKCSRENSARLVGEWSGVQEGGWDCCVGGSKRNGVIHRIERSDFEVILNIKYCYLWIAL